MLCSPAQQVAVTVGPDQLLGVRTGWHDVCANVQLGYDADAQLLFDNLAYTAAQ
jgi:hypothetical protein